MSTISLTSLPPDAGVKAYKSLDNAELIERIGAAVHGNAKRFVLRYDMAWISDLSSAIGVPTGGAVAAVNIYFACVIAETALQAKDAAEAVSLDIEPLPAVTSANEAVKPGAPLVFDDVPGNVALDGTGRNSPYTGPLVKRIGRPGEDVLTVLTDVRNEVLAATSARG